MAKESAIPEVAFDFAAEDAYRNYIDPVVSNIKSNDGDSIGLEKVIKARKWTTLSLYQRTPPTKVYLAPKIKDSTIAWISADTLQIDRSTFDSYLKEEQGKILMRLLMTIMRLETKGELSAYLTQAQTTTTAAAAPNAEIPAEIAAELELQENAAQTASDEAEAMEAGEDAVAMAVAPNTRKALPVINCEDEKNANNAKCLYESFDAAEALRKKLLTDEDKKNIELAADYLLQSGRSGKIADIKAKLKELTIIK
ncbi:hypothetical protein [Bdellovibrio sp. HCB209]|uniref:hypothetical protein n=1 Tax=Bdellovibrio sp. HCB209 TaxID=3394354 RepID=UPI0039B45B9C